MRISPFLLLTSALLLATCALTGMQIISPLELAAPFEFAAWIAYALPFAAIAWLPFVYWRQEEVSAPSSRTEERMLWLSYLSMALVSFILFFVLAREALVLCARAGAMIAGLWNGAGLFGALAAAATGWTSGPSLLPLALFDARGSGIIVSLALLTLAIAYVKARATPKVTHVQVPIADLPPSLEGLKIAQISDLHVGNTIGRDFVEKVVQTVNRLDADLVALTGDLVDGTVEQLKDGFEPLSRLKTKLGVFYVTGNHEHYWEAERWIQHVRALGFNALVNSHATLTQGSSQIVIAGVLDSLANPKNSDPLQALQGAPQNADLRIFLAHQPKAALKAATAGYHLQLSGHTHGGQFLPWTLLVRWFEPFARGLYPIGKMWLYVNRGTGYWGPPARLGSPSEITLVQLTRA